MHTTRPPGADLEEVGAYRPTCVRRTDPEIGLGTLVRPFLRRWPFVAASLAVCWGLALLVILIPEREFRAELTLAAVPSARSTALAGGLSSLLGNAQLGGVQSTPYFITRLLQLRGVVEEVALMPAVGGGRIVDRVVDRPAQEVEMRTIVPALRNLMTVDVDKQTGLVSLVVSHPDSGLARQVAEQLVAVATRRFTAVVRAQAAGQRQAVVALEDSTRRALLAAEERLQNYQNSHRIYESYSVASVGRQRLEREVMAAQEAYTRAVADRQAAVARELEDTPSVVVVDPLPAELIPAPRQAALRMLIATVLAFGLVAAVFAARGEFQSE